MSARRRGVALLAALWLVVTIATVAMGVALMARGRRTMAANLIDGSRARLAAEAGFEHVRSRLTNRVRTSGAPTSVAESGLAPDSVDLGSSAYRVALRDLGVTLNLNRATEDELRRFLVARRVDAGRADRIAQSVLDWRDADDVRRGRGAESEEYLRDGTAVLPSNADFQSVEEFRHVRGVDDALFDELRPRVSVRSSGKVNLGAADRELLLTLPGVTEEVVATIMRGRQSRAGVPPLHELITRLSVAGRASVTSHLPELEARTTRGLQEVEVTSEGTVNGSPMSHVVIGTLVNAGDGWLVAARVSR